VNKALPQVVIALVAALAYYELTTFNPPKIDSTLKEPVESPRNTEYISINCYIQQKLETYKMNYTEFRSEMKAFPNFSVREIKKHFPGFDTRRLVEWQRKGYIKKLRNRFYYFSDRKVNEPFLYYTANQLYHPSYVSLESALSRYGFIPEGVFQITSCTTLKTNSFDTPTGNFAYRHLKPSLLIGYQLEEWDDHRYAIAGPEKTIIDYLYLHNEVKQIADIETLRWNAMEISNKISIKKLNEYEKYIHSPALSKRLQLFKNFLNANT
jgi:predicted transcriptional regulator of viral defense system